jgi:thiamine pyrophosphokinase
MPAEESQNQPVKPLPGSEEGFILRAVIFANGLVNQPATHEPEELVKYQAKNQAGNQIEDLVIIAADGGARHCLRLGITPDVVIGDFDSLDDPELAALEKAGAQFIRHPARKDYTDLELALRYAVEQGAREIRVLGALGARWDQSLANLLLPAIDIFAAANITLVDGPQEIYLVRPEKGLEIQGSPGDTVSLIPLGGKPLGINTHGLEYPLHNESLEFGGTRGISNVLLSKTASVTLKEGLLLCVVIHNRR